jgi:hypothetical protein
LANARAAARVTICDTAVMQADLVRALSARRRDIRARWEALLRIERVNTPLANPEALVFMLDWTLDEVFTTLRNPPARRRAPSTPALCPCGRNPLLAYFAAGKQALVEALVLAQAEHTGLAATERDAALAELKLCVHEITRREIDAFCSVCQFRHDAHPAVLAGSGDT